MSVPAPVLAAFGVEMLLMIVLPIALVVWWCRRTRLSLAVPAVAAGFYLLNLVLNTPLTSWLIPNALGHGLLATALIALVYGTFEETARWLSWKVPVMRRRIGADGGIAAGLGHGGTEAIAFGLPYLIGMTMILLAPAMVPAQVVSQVTGASPWLYVGTGLDRLPAMAMHLLFSLLVVQSYRTGRKIWLFGAMGLHAAVDFVMFTLRDHAPGPVFIGLWAVVGVAALVGVVLFHRRMSASSPVQVTEPA